MCGACLTVHSCRLSVAGRRRRLRCDERAVPGRYLHSATGEPGTDERMKEGTDKRAAMAHELMPLPATFSDFCFSIQISPSCACTVFPAQARALIGKDERAVVDSGGEARPGRGEQPPRDPTEPGRPASRCGAISVPRADDASRPSFSPPGCSSAAERVSYDVAAAAVSLRGDDLPHAHPASDR